MEKERLRTEIAYGLLMDGTELQKSMSTGGPILYGSMEKAEGKKNRGRAQPKRFRVVKVRLLY